MTMFVQLLLFTGACALGAADEVPSYGYILYNLLKASEIINKNVLSMDGNVPLLNYSRRHYAEIIHVITDEGHMENTYLLHDYYTDYQLHVNHSGPFAIANPERVVDGIKNLVVDILKGVDTVIKLVTNSNQAMQANKEGVDKAVDEEINKKLEENGHSRDVFLQLGLVATQLNNNHENDFAQQSQNLSAHNFVVTGAAKLEKIVAAVANLFEKLYGRSHCEGTSL